MLRGIFETYVHAYVHHCLSAPHPWNFAIISTLYICTLNTTIFQLKQSEIFVPFQNDSQITNFHFASFLFWQKFQKNTFLKSFFNEIWLKIEDHEYINIAKIKFGNFYSSGILGAKHLLLHSQNANLC